MRAKGVLFQETEGHPVVNACALIRKMRGGSQARLLGCDDGRFYVVKFSNNPQHRRILINEWIASTFLEYLEIASPDAAIVNLSSQFIDANPDLSMEYGSRKVLPEQGSHFGSCYPGNPSRVAVYDFIPDILLRKVDNLPHFLAVLAFDKWIGNTDGRQSIFFRARSPKDSPAVGRRPGEAPGFCAQMMDNGFILGGPRWTFDDSPLQGLYFREFVYQKVCTLADLQPWLDRIVHFPEKIVDDALRQLPPPWVGGDRAMLENLLSDLMKRRHLVPDLLRDTFGRSKFLPTLGPSA